MHKLLLGAGLLVATLLTGLVAGSSGERRGRSLMQTKTEERIVYRDREEAMDAPAPVATTRGGGAASTTPGREESPETSADLVDRMRRHLPALADWQAAEIRRYHRGFKKLLHEHGMAVAGTLEADPETQRRAVARLVEIRRERSDFMAGVLGREQWEKWREIEITGGRNVEEFLREMRERNPD